MPTQGSGIKELTKPRIDGPGAGIMETMTQSHPGTDAADRDAVPDGNRNADFSSVTDRDGSLTIRCGRDWRQGQEGCVDPVAAECEPWRQANK